jgi:two-component system phosphate regulon response regulator PhoB
MMFVMVTLSQSTHSPRKELEVNKRVLVVEDEGEIRQLVVLHLKREGFEVDEVADGEEARQLASTRSYDLIVLDWMLPSLSGLELTRWVRKRSAAPKTPILFVTAKTEPEHVATGLDAGADDYLTKPFDTLVLMARVNALLRRQEWLASQSAPAGTPAPRPQLVLGGMVLDTDSFELTVNGKPVDLTRSEFRLLETLMQNQGKVLSRESLIGDIQGEGVNVVGRTVDTHVFGLRKKLGAYADVIETIRGVGYRVRYLPPVN